MINIRLFVCSDIHGEYNGFIKALNDNQFDENNNNHKIIICGDIFDRGSGNKQLYDYILHLIEIDKVILVKGNHEQLYDEMCRRGFPVSYDKSNGTLQTLQELTTSTNIVDKFREGYEAMQPIRINLRNYFETENYVFVHSVIPYWRGDDWRNGVNDEWNDAMWENPFNIWSMFGVEGKTVVFGHWGNCEYWSQKLGTSRYGNDAKFDIVYGDGYIGLDGTTILSHMVNMLVIEDNFLE